ncbi:MAG TPA: nitroreductase family protein [Candidatus Cloacimonadota bacterium]|nr:nitroreductase family protein [Candidatus Cloacimonadota bacterium]HPT71901.1 nitroreductase family protein [Candidatus Cloacimonadota bacterium]
MYPNETLQIMNERASVRNFANREIEPEKIDILMQTACNSASGGNLQPVSIIKIQDQAMRTRLGELCWQPFIGKAPLNLLFCMDIHRNEVLADVGEVPYTAQHAFRHFWISFQDVIISAQSVCTAADSLGLGSCYIGTVIDRMEECIELFELPKHVIPIVLVVVGYPASKPSIRPKFKQEVMVHNEKYHEYDPSLLYDKYIEREQKSQTAFTEKQLEVFIANYQAVCGKEEAAAMWEKIRQRGWLTPIQYVFGLHYHSALIPLKNLKLIEILQKQDMHFFEDWQPLDESALAMFDEEE